MGLCLAEVPEDVKSKATRKIIKFIEKEVVYPQVVGAELESFSSCDNLAQKRPRLEYLQLNRQKPKSIPTFAPLIEKDFLVAGHWKERQMNDERIVKKKLARVEKEAQRELKKDTMLLQQEKARLSVQKRAGTKIYRGGNMPKDEI